MAGAGSVVVSTCMADHCAMQVCFHCLEGSGSSPGHSSPAFPVFCTAACEARAEVAYLQVCMQCHSMVCSSPMVSEASPLQTPATQTSMCAVELARPIPEGGLDRLRGGVGPMRRRSPCWLCGRPARSCRIAVLKVLVPPILMWPSLDPHRAVQLLACYLLAGTAFEISWCCRSTCGHATAPPASDTGMQVRVLLMHTVLSCRTRPDTDRQKQVLRKLAPELFGCDGMLPVIPR